MTIAGTNAITELWAKVKAKFAVKGDAVKNITRDGTTFTATKADGNTFTFTQKDTTYSAATTSAAGLMSAADKTKLNGIATGAQVNSVTGVKGNSESSYRTGNVNLTAANVGALGASDNAVSATKLQTARTINVGSYASGTPTSFDGSSNITIPINNLYTHGLTEPSIVKAGTKTSLPLVNTLKGNKLALLPADQVIIEKTTDGGSTWVDAGISDDAKRTLFRGTNVNAGIQIPLLNGVRNVNCGLRITFTPMKYDVPSGTAETSKYNYWNSSHVKSTERYGSLQSMYIWVNAVSDGISCKLERAAGNASTTWTTVFNKDSTEALSGWDGGNYIAFADTTFGGGTNQVGQPWNWRLTFFTRNKTGGTTLSTNSTSGVQWIGRIAAYGANLWTVPNNISAMDHLYEWDNDKNATFPANLSATKLTLRADQYADDGVTGALDLKNSNIVNVNAIYTADAAEGAGEGINFYRDSTHADTLWAAGGDLMFVPNRALGTSTTAANSQKVGRFSSTPVPNRVVVSNGSSGEMQARFLRELRAYNASYTYSEGSLVTYNGEPYVCITAISSPEAWNSSHWKNVHSATGAVAVGEYALAFGDYSYAEGYNTQASGTYSHAEGYYTTASGEGSHAEGYTTSAYGDGSHAEGCYTIASGNRSHAEGYYTYASGDYSHAEGCGTTANSQFQTVVGKYNNYANTSSDHLFIVGNGSDENTKSNAFAVDTDGNVSCGTVNYGTCSTAASTTSKVVYIGLANSNYPKNGFVIKNGVTIRVRFDHANTADYPSLNVNGLGGWPIYVNGGSASSSNPLYWPADSVLEFVYSSGSWVWTGVAYTERYATYIYRQPMGIYVFSSAPTVADLPVRPCFWYNTSDNSLHYESGT